MDIHALYQEKLCTPEEAVRLVKSGDWVDYSQGTSFPAALDRALAARRGELRDVKVRGAIRTRPARASPTTSGTARGSTGNTWMRAAPTFRPCSSATAAATTREALRR